MKVTDLKLDIEEIEIVPLNFRVGLDNYSTYSKALSKVIDMYPHSELKSIERAITELGTTQAIREGLKEAEEGLIKVGRYGRYTHHELTITGGTLAEYVLLDRLLDVLLSKRIKAEYDSRQ